MKWLVPLILLSILTASGCATSGGKKDEIPDIRDTDPLIVQLSSTARQAFDAGEVPKAVVMYRRALDRARAMDNPREIGLNAYNLALGLIALEELDEVPGLLSEAERETKRAGGDAGPVLLLAAETEINQRNWSAAENIIDKLEMTTIDNQTRGMAYVQRARIACERKDASRAAGFLERARGYLGEQKDPGLAAAISEVTAQIAMLQEKWPDAAKAYDRQAAWLQRAGRLPEMAVALELAGQNFLAAGDAASASDRLYRSARSLMAQGNYLDALRVVELAVQSAGPDTGDDQGQAIANLFEEIRRSVEKSSRAGVVTP